MIFNLSEKDSIANQFLLELRDKTIQQDRMRFRKNIERLGEIMAYEVSKKLLYHVQEVETPLGKSRVNVLKHQPLLLTILRAGLPYFQGFLNFFDHADSGFVGAARQEDKNAVAIKFDYLAAPDPEGREIILIDPMMATGFSVMDSIAKIVGRGIPSHIHIVSLVAAPEGIKYLTQNLSLPYSLWTCTIDEKLNQQFYIVPGLGDAGDLCYGTKE
jgi:uracil phosphoribosyltransferase